MVWLKPDTGYKWIIKNKEEKFKVTMNKIQHLKNRFILGWLFVRISITGQFFHHRMLVFFQLKKLSEINITMKYLIEEILVEMKLLNGRFSAVKFNLYF